MDVDLRLVTLVGLLDMRGGIVVGDETLTGLVGMQDTTLLSVGCVDFLLVCIGLDAEEGVEGGIATLVQGDFVLQAEDFVVCHLSVSEDEMQVEHEFYLLETMP